MNNLLETENLHATRRLRHATVAFLAGHGITASRLKTDDIPLLHQGYLLTSPVWEAQVALRTSTTGAFGFRMVGDRFPVLDQLPHVLLAVGGDHLGSMRLYRTKLRKSADIDVALRRQILDLHALGAPVPEVIWIAFDAVRGEASALSALPDYDHRDGPEILPEQVRPEFATAVGMPDWLEAVILERSMMAVISPEDLIRTILVDHFAPLRPVAVADTVVPLSVGIPLWAMTALSARAEGLGMDASEFLKVMAVRAAVDEATPGVAAPARGPV